MIKDVIMHYSQSPGRTLLKRVSASIATSEGVGVAFLDLNE
jgi:hypothetical protein